MLEILFSILIYQISQNVFILDIILLKKIRMSVSYHEFILTAPRVGLEPTTTRLTAECSTIELSRIMCLSVSFVLCSLNQHPYYNTSCKFVNTFFKENSIFLIACLICNDSKHFKEDYTLNRCYFPLNKMHQPVN